jgi:ADP-ribose pyrophosphatase YjhB (NUDIX family)
MDILPLLNEVQSIARTVLLMLRTTDDKKWCLPCGFVEPNESPMDAAFVLRTR